MPVSLPSSSRTARTLRLCSKVRRAILSANCFIDTPALTRRTLDWLKTSLLKGMSREGLSLIFWTALAISDAPRRAAERLSLDLQPVTDIPALLSLSSALRRQTAETVGECITRPPRRPRRRRRLLAAGIRAGNRPPSRPRSPRAPPRGYPRAALSAMSQCNRRDAPSAQSRARRRRRRQPIRQRALRVHIISSRTNRNDRA